MPDSDPYASQAARLPDDWPFSRIFASEAARPGFTALLALREELQRLAAEPVEPGIAAIKFEWWRGEIERAFTGNAQHPLARVLGERLAHGAPEYCIELVDAAETERDADGLTEQDFRLYLYRSGGVLAEQLALLSGITDRRSLDAARRLGELKRFIDLLLACGAMRRAGRWLFPRDWLHEHGLDVAALNPRLDDSRIDKLLGFLLDALDRERIATRTAMQEASLPPALAVQWALAQRDHARLRDAPRRMLAPQPDRGVALLRLWTAWRAARHAARGKLLHH